LPFYNRIPPVSVPWTRTNLIQINEKRLGVRGNECRLGGCRAHAPETWRWLRRRT